MSRNEEIYMAAAQAHRTGTSFVIPHPRPVAPPASSPRA
jgi:hypothetical protein